MSALPISNSNDHIAELIKKVNDLAVLPHVVFKVLEISGSSDAPATDMERAIVVDPGFSTKVLSLANSAGMGLPRRVNSIREAIAFLGFRQVRNLAMTVGVFDLFVGKTDRESLRRRTWWRHSIDSAVCAKWLATKTRKVDADEAYTCGLLHYIGRTLLDRFGGEDYDLVIQFTEKGWDASLAERQIYGCDHVDLGAAAAAKWGIPPLVREGLRYLDSTPGGEGHLHRAATALASEIARLAPLVAAEKAPAEWELPIWALQALGLESESAETLLEEGGEAIARARLSL